MCCDCCLRSDVAQMKYCDYYLGMYAEPGNKGQCGKPARFSVDYPSDDYGNGPSTRHLCAEHYDEIVKDLKARAQSDPFCQEVLDGAIQ